MDFAVLLFGLLLLSGAIWLIDEVWLARHRGSAGAPPAKIPWWVEYGRSFFPVILAVFLLRSFLVEPFRIPSGSMIPTLAIGDFILVNKFAYGIRLPIIDKKIIEIDSPQRGDVMVFRYPPEPSIDYIKRVIGVPGDRIGYYDKVLYVNGEQVTERDAARSVHEEGMELLRLPEHLGTHRYDVQWMPQRPSPQGEVVVPPGQYFVMGDNRDNSKDSRYWGFVPDQNLVGKAFFIWMSWDGDRFAINWRRIGSSIP
ncbi:MAG: signal peptidase I [Immundisolibacter sp.]|uniref:signal peptidase I n=1 Tax=Immundisolibacter sp. TaxID=1934948 RepID=UPI003EE2BD9D